MPDLSDADPVAVVHEWLRDHPQIIDLLGGPDHVTGLPESPWPHAVTSDGPGGDMRDLVWEGEFEVTLELWGSPAGAPGQAELRRLAMRLAKLVADLPEQQSVTAETPVVSRARPSGVLAWAPTTAGQPRYLVGVLVTIRPPLS